MSNIKTGLALAAVCLLMGCAASHFVRAPDKGPAALPVRLAIGSYRDLPGWSADTVSQAVPAFVKSCARLQKAPDGAPLDPMARGADFGELRDWLPICQVAAALPRGDEAAARRFFETNFTPMLVGSRDDDESLFTGYWEVELNGSRTRGGPYQTPVYRRPPDLADDTPYLDRGAIEDGALAGKGLEVMWLESPDDLFVLQMQGSGHIHLPDGSAVHLVYAANNNQPFVDINRVLVGAGAIPAARFSEAAARAWMRGNPEKAKALRRKDPLYVFFEELKGEGPVGYEGAVLTAERSLAVDHRYIPLGAPLWLDAKDKYRPVGLRRLVVAQDTGDGITGPLRGDFYWGSGKTAAARGSDFCAEGQYWILLPKSVANRMVAALN